MSEVHYRIVEHDGGWAYKACGVYSETFPSHDEALARAKAAAEEQRSPGETLLIEYQDQAGRWLVETADGQDRPTTFVDD